jgi:hypothetical protein
MAAHKVEFTVPTRELGRADIEFKVRRDDRLFGTLAVSNGSLVWFRTDTTYGLKIPWAEFDAFMQGNATGRERRRKRGGA